MDSSRIVSSVGTRQEEANKATSIAFYEAALNEHNFEKALQYIGPTYTQHNPNASDDIAGFAGFLAFLRENHPLSRGIIKRIWADGDYVILHVLERRHPDDRGDAVVDIFRLDAGKIVEHWDVTQPIPETLAHANGMI
ncbi:nuclear transport factor 2 family protein [Bosea sp. SSUT16]|uniref:Nuclear transport factor 2 family protein n=2 Tax=Bosea spartocytisi TaxID=2773451 RepID=A0A927EFR7_9HYPH|nr:nuclear transport factor 2 family protein [Bosea spartocytisi]